jgi:hypothetical protein
MRITTFISCTTQPIIEASAQMKFACLSCNYENFDGIFLSFYFDFI